MKEKRDVAETVLTVIGVIAGILVAAQWTLYYLLTTGVISF